MSTLKTNFLQHPSSSTVNATLTSGGNLTGAGMDLVASQTFTSASSVSINSCFTSTYENYRIVCSFNASSTTANYYVRLRAAGTDESSNNYIYGGWDVNTSGGTGAPANGGTNHLFVGGLGSSNAERCKFSMDLHAPALTKQSVGLTQAFIWDGTSNYMRLMNSALSTTTSYDGVSLIITSGTANGTIRVYGYRNS